MLNGLIQWLDLYASKTVESGNCPRLMHAGTASVIVAAVQATMTAVYVRAMHHTAHDQLNLLIRNMVIYSNNCINISLLLQLTHRHHVADSHLSDMPV